MKTFLSLQESVTNTRASTAAFDSLKDSLKLTSFSLEPSKDVRKLLSYPVTFGSLIKSNVNFADVSLPDIKFPISTKALAGPGGAAVSKTRPAAQKASIGQIKANTIGTFNIKTKDDRNNCWINGIAITPSGQRLLVDQNNKNVKLFSQDMTFLSSVSVSGRPWDITMMNDREAVVTVGKSLVFLVVSDRQLRIEHTIDLSFESYGNTNINDKLIVTAGAVRYPTQVKALNMQGTEQWSVGQSLFKDARYVCNSNDGHSVAVTDCDNSTVTVLDVNTGAVITSRQLERYSGLRGLAIDISDNIYVHVCCYGKILVLFDMNGQWRQAIAYDETDQLLIIHDHVLAFSCGTLTRLQLT